MSLRGKSVQPECVGCGYCCRQAVCAAAASILGFSPKVCPFLIYSDERYWCSLVMAGDRVAHFIPDIKEHLCIGYGCCSSMNTDRLNIPPPKEAHVYARPEREPR